MSTQPEIDQHIASKSGKVSAIFGSLELENPGTILDIATGDAVVPMVLRRNFPDATILAVDRDITFASKLLATRNVRGVTLLERDVAATGLQEDSVDLVILYQVLHHLSEQSAPKCLREAARVLKLTGRMVVVESSIESLDPQQTVWLELHRLEADIDGALEKQGEKMRSRTDIESLLQCTGFTAGCRRDFAEFVDDISSQSIGKLEQELRAAVAKLPERKRMDIDQRLTELLSIARRDGATTLPSYAFVATLSHNS